MSWVDESLSPVIPDAAASAFARVFDALWRRSGIQSRIPERGSGFRVRADARPRMTPGFFAEPAVYRTCIDFNQPPSFSRRVFVRPSNDHSDCAPGKSPRARGTPGSVGPAGCGISRRRSRTAIPLKTAAHLSKQNRKSAEPIGVPRAVFEVCSAAPPVV